MTDEPEQSQGPQATNWEDRRATPRHKADIGIFWRLSEEKSQEARKGQLVDLSISGAAIRIDEELPENASISIKLPPASNQSTDASNRPMSSFSVRGKIVNSRPLDDGGWRYGIKFDRLYYTLAQWVRQVIGS